MWFFPAGHECWREQHVNIRFYIEVAISEHGAHVMRAQDRLESAGVEILRVHLCRSRSSDSGSSVPQLARWRAIISMDHHS